MTAPRAPSHDRIRLEGVRQHNLKGICVEIPVGALTVVTGVSGSGKSSLAFDTLYAEGQRRYVESFSAYSRQFLERMDRPDVERVEGMLPAVALERSRPVRGSRSSVATLAELLDPLKLLWARAGELDCRRCARPVRRESPGSVADRLAAEPPGTRLWVGFDLPLGPARTPAEALAELRAAGFTRWQAGPETRLLPADPAEVPAAEALFVLVDRLVVGTTPRARLAEALELAFRAGGGSVRVRQEAPRGPAEERRYAEGLRCGECGTAHREPTPNLYSFNSPIGACPECHGFGRTMGVDWDLVVPDGRRSLATGAIDPFERPAQRALRRRLLAWCEAQGIDTGRPWRDLPEAARRAVLEGGPGWKGVRGFFRAKERKAYKVHVRVLLARYRGYPTCGACGGDRLGPEGRAWRVGGLTLPALLRHSVADARRWAAALTVPAWARAAAEVLVADLRARLEALDEVGLGYLTLDRQARTLSGGEVQRVNLTAAIGTRLVNTLFVLDEPSVGLHARDSGRLVRMLRRLCDQGNTLVVVEHDLGILAAADHVIDLGPGAGERGGHVVAAGPPAALAAAPESLTGRWLAGRERLRRAAAPAPAGAGDRGLGVLGARAHNLAGVDLLLAPGELTVLSGVSGSGKSTLAHDVLYLALVRELGRPEGTPGAHAAVRGADRVSDVVWVGQAASGRNARANPATYSDAWSPIREWYAALPEARAEGLRAASFSFNVPGGRCEVCAGAGVEQVEMQFLSDVEVTCAECQGTRFRPEVRAVRWQGLSISDVLGLTVDEASERFAGVRRVGERLAGLREVGLGYLRLGQALSTLSSGEWQRVRLAQALAEPAARGPRLYVFDEPTTGLHMADVALLLGALRRLCAQGHFVLVVEHHLDLLRAADRVVDLGPGGGPKGGRVVGDGPPEAIARLDTETGRALRARPPCLGRRPSAVPRGRGAGRGAAAAIRVRGAREHNLRDLDVDIPRDALVVVSGPSGSGKSTLAFDVVFAEGQRRYIDTLSAYARQFVGQLARPDVDRIEGIPPTVAIEQRRTQGGRRSTVATVTEVAHFLRLLFARAGTPHCPACDRALEALPAEALEDRVREHYAGATVRLLAPRVWGRKGFHRDEFAAMARRGHARARVDGAWVATDPPPALDRYAIHDLEEEVAALDLGAPGAAPALRAALAEALALGGHSVRVVGTPGGERLYSTRRTCPRDGTTVPELDPRFFSHNSQRGWCPSCRGLGTRARVIAAGIPVDATAALGRGALPVLGSSAPLRASFLREARQAFGVTAQTPWRRIPPGVRRALLHGGPLAGGRFRGVAERLEEVLDAAPDVAIDWFGDYVTRKPCPACGGERLRPEARAVRLGGRRLPELLGASVAEFLPAVERLVLDGRAERIAAPVRRELRERVEFLERLGLGYLTLDRTAATLSGGESQRIRLAAQLGSGLAGVCTVLDEPTIGLHPRDNARLLEALDALRARGNSLLVVEHDLETVARADRVIDLGPGGGRQGGRIVAEGTPAELARDPRSPTGRLLARPPPALRAAPRASGAWLRLRGARLHNLGGVDLDLPLGALVAVTGVSGAGKSTLVHGVLVPALKARLAGRPPEAEPLRSLEGHGPLARVLEVDATPVGKTPRSVPATYLGLWDEVRRVLSLVPEARARGFRPGRFSYNRKGGRCPACEGLGEITVEMSFLPDVRQRCEECQGRRFNPETLAVRWRGRDAAALLGLTFEEALAVFSDLPRVEPAARWMNEIGLGYLTLGQPSPTLSGGEAQRLKLVAELAGAGRGGPTLYVLDEPTVGLHGEDVDRLRAVLERLVQRGDTVLLIEHHLELVAHADHVVDLGPEGGADGGRIVDQGPPADLARRARTHTGRALARLAATRPPTAPSDRPRPRRARLARA